MFDGIDPDLVPSIPGSTVLRLGLDGFLGLHVMTASGVRLTVKHVIGYVRNVDGGGHYDPRELTGEYKVLRRIAGNLLAPGLDSARMQVRGISRVVLKGLTPVIVDVRARLDASRGRPAPPAPATS